MVSGWMPAPRNSSSVKKVMDSVPLTRFFQNCRVSLAPGNRQSMPMTAMAFSGTLFVCGCMACLVRMAPLKGW